MDPGRLENQIRDLKVRFYTGYAVKTMHGGA
jgi:hypothetical protein